MVISEVSPSTRINAVDFSGKQTHLPIPIQPTTIPPLPLHRFHIRPVPCQIPHLKPKHSQSRHRLPNRPNSRPSLNTALRRQRDSNLPHFPFIPNNPEGYTSWPDLAFCAQYGRILGNAGQSARKAHKLQCGSGVAVCHYSIACAKSRAGCGRTGAEVCCAKRGRVVGYMAAGGTECRAEWTEGMGGKRRLDRSGYGMEGGRTKGRMGGK